MEGSRTVVASVVGYPHGWQTTAAKLYEARDLLRRGAREVEMVLNLGKLLSRQFQYLESEMLQMVDACRSQGAILKAVVETGALTDELKIVACKMSKLAGADFAKATGAPAAGSRALEDLRLMKARLRDHVKLAAGEVDTLEMALEACGAGCSRFSTEATRSILKDWKAELERRAAGGKS
jgi:deoxyribose-phosphate aldolase